MNRKKNVAVFTVAALLMLVAGLALNWMKNNQQLGLPGVKTHPYPDKSEGSLKVQVDLPAFVKGYMSEKRDMDEIVVQTLPSDTSYGQRIYESLDGNQIQVATVLMGMDRTSIHKPQFCLVGAGWQIDAEELVTIPIPDPKPYDLEVSKIKASKMVSHEGQQYELSGIYVYWFVEESEITARHEQRMASMARSMISRGVLQRWAYISCFAACNPGQEEAAFTRIQRFMADAVPLFQIPAGTPAMLAQGSVNSD